MFRKQSRFQLKKLLRFSDFGAFSSIAAIAPSPLQRNSVTMPPTYSEGIVYSTYKLGPGDYLDIMLENNYHSAKVCPEGNVFIEECGSVNVAEMTVASLCGRRRRRSR